MSQRALGKRLAELQGSNGDFEKRWKAQTRYIQKLMTTPEMIPGRKKLDAIEAATGRPGYFKPPTRAAVAVRRATTEEEVEYLRLAAGVLLDMVALLCEQVTKLGGEVPAGMLESSALEVLRRHRKADAL